MAIHDLVIRFSDWQLSGILSHAQPASQRGFAMKHSGIDYGVARDPNEPTKFRFTIYSKLPLGSTPKIVSSELYTSYDEAVAACKEAIDLGKPTMPQLSHGAVEARLEPERPHQRGLQHWVMLPTGDDWLRTLLRRVDQQEPWH
jgi:hypothetical protein